MTSSRNYFGVVTAADINISARDGSSLLSLESAKFGSVYGVLQLGAAGITFPAETFSPFYTPLHN